MAQYLNDYIDLFTGQNKGHLTRFGFMCDDDYYEKLLAHSDYYLCSVEADLIKNCKDKIGAVISDVHQVIELGPGYLTSLEKKTIPLLESLSSFEIYSALDSNDEFAKLAAREVGKVFGCKQSYFQYNYLSKVDRIKQYLSKGKQNNCIVFLGSSIGNLSEKEIDKLFQNICSMSNSGDYFILSIDCNQDEVVLEAAYNNYWLKQISRNILRYLKELAELPNFDPESFEFSYKWNKDKRRVEMGLIANSSQIITLEGQDFQINPGDYYHLINSRKFLESEILEVLQKNDFKVSSVFNSDPKGFFKFFICRKV
jgi:uncharacterized SAM-dependent methyltransferase